MLDGLGEPGADDVVDGFRQRIGGDVRFRIASVMDPAVIDNVCEPEASIAPVVASFNTALTE